MPKVADRADADARVSSPRGVRPDPAASDATRYLCAAAHVDPAFARNVLAEVLFQPHRAVAPSYGIDLAPIVRHCIKAYRRAVWRDALVVLLIVAAVAWSGMTAIVIVLSLSGVGLGVRALRELSRANFAAALIHLVMGWVAVLAAYGLFGLLAQTRIPLFRPHTSVGAVLGSLAVILLGTTLVLTVQRLAGAYTVVHQLGPGRFSPARSPREPRQYTGRIAFLETAQTGNVTVYSTRGTAHEFVGSGVMRNGWSFAMPLVARQGADHPAAHGGATAAEIYDSMRAELASLNRSNLPDDQRLHGLRVYDRLYVSGVLRPGDPFLDTRAHRPIQHVSHDVVTAVMRSDRGHVRHFLTTRSTSWNGEVEVTCLTYVAVRGHMLYVEFIGTSLPGIASSYHRVDTTGVVDGLAVLTMLARSAAEAFVAPLLAPLRLLGDGRRALVNAWRRARESWAIHRQVGYDYGARTSVRELGSEWSGTVYFQTLDATQQIQTIERCVVAALAQFLRDRGYDTSEFDRRANIVFNSGVMISNSSVAGAAFAVGKGATARAAPTGNVTGNVAQPAPSSGGRP